MTIYSVCFGVFVSAIVGNELINNDRIFFSLFQLTLPPWSIYRNNPIEWQKAVDSSKENKNNSNAKSPKKDTRKPKAKKDE